MFFFAFSLLYIDPEMEAGGRFGERFKMSALSPFWSSREFFMIVLFVFHNKYQSYKYERNTAGKSASAGAGLRS